MKPPRIMGTYGYLDSAKNTFRFQLDLVELEEKTERNLRILDKGIEVLTYLNQTIAKLEELEEILNVE